MAQRKDMTEENKSGQGQVRNNPNLDCLPSRAFYVPELTLCDRQNCCSANRMAAIFATDGSFLANLGRVGGRHWAQPRQRFVSSPRRIALRLRREMWWLSL